MTQPTSPTYTPFMGALARTARLQTQWGVDCRDNRLRHGKACLKPPALSARPGMAGLQALQNTSRSLQLLAAGLVTGES